MDFYTIREYRQLSRTKSWHQILSGLNHFANFRLFGFGKRLVRDLGLRLRYLYFNKVKLWSLAVAVGSINMAERIHFVLS